MEKDYKYEKWQEFFNPKGSITKIGIAIFGLGRAGAIHLKNAISNNRIELLYIVEEKAERGEQMKNGHGLDQVTFLNSDDESVEKVLSDPKVKAIIIATPTDKHFGIAMKAIDHGKAIFTEKPLAQSIEDTTKCFEKAKKAGIPLFCAFQRRFDPSYAAMKKRVDNKELGRVHIVKSCSRDSPLPSIEYLKISHGFFHDSTVHDIDLICWILGEFPEKVFAFGTSFIREIGAIGDFDSISVQMMFPSKAIGIIDMSRLAVYGYDNRLEVFGEKGMILSGNEVPFNGQVYTSEGTKSPNIHFSFASRYEFAYYEELDAFLDTVEGKRPLAIKAEETIAVCKIATACEESCRTGQPVSIQY